jgi:hypothetical protein
MLRVLIGLIALMLVFSLAPLPVSQRSTSAQDANAEATMEALQTRVAELEEQLAITPTSTVGQNDSPANTRHAQVSIGGTALEILPRGKLDSLEIIAVGSYTDHLAVVVRNNSQATLDRISVAATARSADGSLLASGESDSLDPFRLAPGEVAFGIVDFGQIGLPPSAVFDLSLESSTAQPLSDSNELDLEIIETADFPDRIVGEVRNGTGRTVEDAVMTGMCFNNNGLPTRSLFRGLNPGTLRPDESSTFQVSPPYEGGCPLYLVAAHGWDF